MLHVDLKTIHNWVGQGHLTGRRTRGRHLRFDRSEVVQFMRQYGYVIPDFVGSAAPRVVVDVDGSRPSWTKALARNANVTECPGLYAAALAAAGGEQEVIVLDLDKRPPALIAEFLNSLREWSMTRGIVVIGISKKPATRTKFLAGGGDYAVAAGKEADLKAAVRWITGASESQPGTLEYTEEAA